ncbi:Transcription factor vib-1 [Sporothrix brasiliensis 5110]|uniref:Transcription factor vib-1 n=1 Tax=Sporothrix brasiliensis 5110 TaxID=1398154 RepID=A0A0C2IQJ7_9PEZI|nr:Transcription factor vib-1 [Sporothrix brasiliensis 5110]KIH89155.1 Transcription factor vib-1 [Sporothrix brasiliensis 5110]
MAELKEPSHGIWTGYGSPVQMANGRFGHPGALDPVLANAAAAAPPGPQSARPRTDATGYPYTRYPQDDTDIYGRHHSTSSASGVPHPSLTTHQSYPNLKRTYSQTEQHQQPPPSQAPPYGDMVQDIRTEDGSKVNVNQGHKLLSFRRAADKHTIVDRHGRIQQLDLSAQLHGMFFLSELPTSSSDGSVLQPELTCYRRNLFQISGTLITPRGQLSVVNEGGESVAVSSTELTISAIESVDGHPIRLIVIPWKTPPPNSPEVAQNPDQEPVPLPLIPFQDDGSEAEGEYAVYPIGWRRLQFRIATANNGRRKELQQHFVLHLKAVATLANGSKVVLAESTTAPIVVRGRSPRNFQARKEIPLLGSSAGSRGQALVETGMGIVAGPLTVKTQDKARAMALDLPRSSFTFTAAPKMPPSPLSMRSKYVLEM